MPDGLIKAMLPCPGCGYSGSEKFCGRCGEKIRPERITLRYILDQWVDVYLGIETGLIHTFICLLKAPGIMIRDYFSGNRQPYYKPMKYALLIASFTIVVTLAQKGDQVAGLDANNDILFKELYVLFRENISLILNLIAIFQFPIAAFFTWWRNRKANYTYGEHLYVNAWITGELLVFQLLSDGVHWISRRFSANIDPDNIFIYVGAVYFAYVYSSWIHGRIRWPRFILTVLFTGTVYILSYLIALVLCFLLMYVYAILFLRH